MVDTKPKDAIIVTTKGKEQQMARLAFSNIYTEADRYVIVDAEDGNRYSFDAGPYGDKELRMAVNLLGTINPAKWNKEEATADIEAADFEAQLAEQRDERHAVEVLEWDEEARWEMDWQDAAGYS